MGLGLLQSFQTIMKDIDRPSFEFEILTDISCDGDVVFDEEEMKRHVFSRC
ncbi:MAG: hypothetical protein H6766_05535 [Candidatus Peribacteria bacterium]|nr:MAG: hypothetical protein H6766_05535 [Candidatus Peribacteria bacterium]